MTAILHFGIFTKIPPETLCKKSSPRPPLGGLGERSSPNKRCIDGGETIGYHAAQAKAHRPRPSEPPPPGGVQKGEVNMDEMTTREVDRLADWLMAHGFSADQVLECIKYITGTTPPPEK